MPDLMDILNLIPDARAAAVDHRFDEASAVATQVLASAPHCLVALRVLAWSQLELDDERALATFQHCAELDPEDVLANVGQAIWHQQHGDKAAAIPAWVRAWELEPHNQSIRRALVRLTGELPESVLADGISLMRIGRPDEAAEALRCAGDDMAANAVLLDAFWEMGDQRSAFDLALALLANQARGVKPALYVAALEDRAGRTLRSRELMARAEQVDPGLVLFGDVVRRIGLQAALELHSASRGAVATARSAA